MGLRSSWRYRLGKITVSCPSCHMRRFKPYVDENGQMLSALCGRCNRENSCGYHLTPSEYFHQHPDHLTFVGSDVADLLEHRLRPPR